MHIKKTYNKIIWILFIIYFAMPHHLFQIAFGIKEIKPTDLIAVILVGIIVIKLKFRIISKWNYAYICLAGMYLIYGLINLFSGNVESLLFSLKMLQYLITVLALGYLNQNQLKSLIKWTVVLTILWSTAELLGLNVGLLWGGRLTGQYGGPYELSAVLVLMILFIDNGRALNIIELILLFLTKTKASILSYLVGIAFGNGSRNIFKVLITISIILSLTLIIDERVILFLNEAINLLSLDNIDFIYNNLPEVKTVDEYKRIWEMRDEFTINSEFTDLSTGARLYTYLLFFKTINYGNLLFGNGPGYYGAALDSSILRLFGELGLMGLFSGLLVIRGISKNLQMKNSFFLLIILMSLSDIFYSAKFFIFLVVLSNYSHLKRLINEKNSINK